MLKLKNPISEILERGEGLISDFSMTAMRTGRGICLSVTGVVAISQLTETEVVLKSHRAILNIYGKKLVLTVFENKTVEVVGVIKDLEFSYGKS